MCYALSDATHYNHDICNSNQQVHLEFNTFIVRVCICIQRLCNRFAKSKA